VLFYFGRGQWRILQTLRLPYPRNLTIFQDSHLWDRTALGIAQTTETPGQTPLVVNGVVVGPFEEEEEEISIHSDGGRGKWRDFRTGAATQHLQSATAQGRAAVEGFSPTSPRAHWIRPE